jgi:Skp family chaperone for outer membrane proteins
VRITLFWATTVAASLTALSASLAQAQPQAGPPAQPGATGGQAPQSGPPARGGSPGVSNHGIAVVDIKYVLENYARVKAATEQFNRDFEDTGARFKKEKEAIGKKAEKIKGFKAGTPDYKKLEEEITQAESDLKVKASLAQKEFGEREAKIYLTAFQEITQQVKTYADRNGITLVLRFNGAPPDPNNQQAVQAELFKMVLYQNGLDITGPVLQELNRGAAAAAGGVARPPARPNPGEPVRK